MRRPRFAASAGGLDGPGPRLSVPGARRSRRLEARADRPQCVACELESLGGRCRLRSISSSTRGFAVRHRRNWLRAHQSQ